MYCNISTCGVYRWKHDSIPNRACVTLVEYDL